MTVAVQLIFFRLPDPFQHRLRLGPQTGGNNHPGKIVQDPRQKTLVDMLTENLPINLNFCFKIKNIWNIDILYAIGEGLQIGEDLAVLRVHQGKEQRVDPLFDILHLMDTVTDDVVQFHQAARCYAT